MSHLKAYTAVILTFPRGVYYLPSDVRSRITGKPSARQMDSWGTNEWEEYNSRQKSEAAAKHVIEAAKAYNKTKSPSTAKTSRLPSRFSTKASRMEPTLDDTPVSQVSELTTHASRDDTTRDNAPSVGGDPYYGHPRSVAGVYPVTYTRSPYGSATSASGAL